MQPSERSTGLSRPSATRLSSGGCLLLLPDDEPAPPQDVVAYAAKLLDVPPPPEQDFETAELTPMARSFYGENKRVSNARVKSELGYAFQYPTYRKALDALYREGWK